MLGGNKHDWLSQMALELPDRIIKFGRVHALNVWGNPITN